MPAENPNNAAPGPTLADRITNLEMLFTHLERTVSELNSVILEQGRRLDEAVARIEQIQSLGAPNEEDDPESLA